MSQKTIKRITYGAFLAFFLFGFADNLKGPTFPVLLDDLNFSYSVGGSIALGAYLGFLVATLVTGPLSDIAGKKVVMFIVCACLFVGMLGFSVSSAFWALVVEETRKKINRRNVMSIMGVMSISAPSSTGW